MAATGLVLGYLVISLLMLKVPRYLNGSILYAPTIVVLLGLAVYHYTSRQPDRRLLGLVTILFTALLKGGDYDRVAVDQDHLHIGASQ